MQPSLMTLVLLAPTQAIASELIRVATSEPTQVTKVTVQTSTIDAPSEFTQASIVAQLQKDSILPASSNSAWVEPSWLLYSDATPTETSVTAPIETSVTAPTETAAAAPTSKRDKWHSNPKEFKLDVIIFFGVTGGLIGLMASLCLLGSCAEAYQRRSRAKKASASSSNNDQPRDIERTAGLPGTVGILKSGANNSSRTPAAGEAGEAAQQGGVVIMMPEFPAPVYRNNILPQDIHSPEGETAPLAPQGSASVRPTGS
ncbi:hypothetical protein COCC4DRAFT_63888 [Bipolaris maydis ATCC 48331]|uniref:Mid2 domain-containing protein n=2 Tax=Cochliobolus heterostrophus TaxID=5016 RepID=M2SKU4_COCH5|nr:uncharacterized protein COCC4DRAFT_63888 [Bipolaris maydis ATCC 48331]EMD85925.1 hypothetical protein COCHEDRAFT_1160866 [Bipolaris maydis C5]KAJ5028286.1 hypothetical protein J3E73DRAFT_368718 [Bipolaris maydis]ENI01926.1 hypothetical protein COCC4DRAFT_63888 [Bipolaris maydis ATCC 48331]KAJ5063064.1 hypothetical protein J3E74DRAFT_404689 [Bipolaris maydis]KAJ6204037.1 hypothetical protein PSV09DRAFT_1160866 [Bipolaris maydis]